jgi:hypothetical protein
MSRVGWKTFTAVAIAFEAIDLGSAPDIGISITSRGLGTLLDVAVLVGLVGYSWELDLEGCLLYRGRSLGHWEEPFLGNPSKMRR